MPGIDEQLDDPALGYAFDLSEQSPTLLVYFGGLRPGEAVPRFDWIGVSRAVPTKRLYLRDHDQAWYHRGVQGLGSSIAETARSLDGLIRRIAPERVAFVGNSFGGYGAILFGALLGADAVHTYSPQTFVTRRERERHGEGRWRAEMARIEAAGGGIDLKPFLRGLGVPPVPVVVHYATDDACDVAQARELETVPGVELRAHPEGGHFLVRLLKQRGDLTRSLAALA